MLLDGKNLQGFIKERQFRQVRAMHSRGTTPQLAIINTGVEPATKRYLRTKQAYAADIGARASLHQAQAGELTALIGRLNQDVAVHGIIVQLPLPAEVDTAKILALVAPHKDVDGLGRDSPFVAPTALGIMWLLGGYGIDLSAKKTLVIGQGRLVGTPVTALLKRAGLRVETADDTTRDLAAKIARAAAIITAAGEPGLVRSRDVAPGTIVIDAATTDVDGRLVGDCEPALYERDDIKISPVPGGVAPMTVAALFENLIQAANMAEKS